MMLSLTFSCPDLDDIVIVDHPNLGDYWFDEDGITWPGFPVRLETAPDSNDIDGTLVLGYTRGSGQMSLGFYTHGATLAEVRANMLALEVMTYRLDCSVTLSIDGMTDEVYECLPALPLWGEIDSGEVRARMIDGELTLPLNPPAVA